MSWFLQQNMNFSVPQCKLEKMTIKWLEFFFVKKSILNFSFRIEATYSGCFPVCPKSLVYTEIYPQECLFTTEAQLYKILRNFCKNPQLSRKKRQQLQERMNFERFDWENLKFDYAKMFGVDLRDD